MALKIIHKNSVVSGNVPTAAQLDIGEIAINANANDAQLYIKDTANTIRRVGGGGASGGGSDNWAVEHDNTITTSYTIGTGSTTSKNVISAGPMTINAGAVITVPAGSNWVIV